MTHYMRLNSRPFSMIEKGLKTIELRLFDEKRKTVKTGDTIVFTNIESKNETLVCKVERLHIYESFEELYKALPLDKCGYMPEEIPTALPSDMEEYYSKEKQSLCGVVGFEISLLSKEASL